jgi:hypothetical protein
MLIRERRRTGSARHVRCLADALAVVTYDRRGYGRGRALAGRRTTSPDEQDR